MMSVYSDNNNGNDKGKDTTNNDSCDNTNNDTDNNESNDKLKIYSILKSND